MYSLEELQKENAKLRDQKNYTLKWLKVLLVLAVLVLILLVIVAGLLIIR